MARFLTQLAKLLTLLFLLSPVLAAGSLRNNSPWTMKYTTDPNSSTAPNLCRFWNWWTPSNPIPRDATVRCTQKSLRGNGGQSSGDVDGFTFADREFWVNGARKTRGIWTKITDINSVLCEDSFGRAWCIW